MATRYCQLCQRFVSARRKIGVGTLIACIVTFGLWILVIPLYRKRCPICFSDALIDSADDGNESPKASSLYQPAKQGDGAWAQRVGYLIGRHPVGTAVLALLVVWALSRDNLGQQQSGSTSAAPMLPVTGPSRSAPVASVPAFRVFRQKLGFPVPVIVPEHTSEQQLQALLWFIREEVQHGDFAQMGIYEQTSPKKADGGYDFSSGMILIFRGEKCAGENFFDEFAGNGPCGYGDHNAASYHWGIGGDPANDAGDITEPDGNLKIVFGR